MPELSPAQAESHTTPWVQQGKAGRVEVRSIPRHHNSQTKFREILVSFFQKEMQRLNAAELPDIPMDVLQKPEVIDYMAEVQRCMVCWEPWLLRDWPLEKIESLGLNSQYQETLGMVAAASIYDLERYTELYQRFRDHNEFEFEEFFAEVLKMAEQQGFKWEGPMDKLPPVPNKDS